MHRKRTPDDLFHTISNSKLHVYVHVAIQLNNNKLLPAIAIEKRLITTLVITPGMIRFRANSRTRYTSLAFRKTLKKEGRAFRNIGQKIIYSRL